MIKTCKFCGKSFETTRSYREYCSNDCRDKSSREYQKRYREAHKDKSSLICKICKYCGASFSTSDSRKKYCSRACGDKYYRENRKEKTTKEKGGKHASSFSYISKKKSKKADFSAYNAYIKENGYISYGEWQSKARGGY